VARQTQQQRIDALLEKWPPDMRAAFIESIRDIVDRVRLNEIIKALENGDIEGAVRATHVEAAAFQPLDTAIRQAFLEGGTATAATMPSMRDLGGTPIVFRFDVRMPAAENWLTAHSSSAITEIAEDQRTAIRSALTAGMERGDNPRSTALDVVGRRNTASGRREGGIIGLTSVQAQYVANAQRELLSGEPAQLRRYLGRDRRDRRFDPQVLLAIRAGKPIDAATVTKMAGRYADRLLALRGEIIGRTETMAAINASRHQAWEQAAAKGGFSVDQVEKGWVAVRDLRTRDTHRHMNGEKVKLQQRFSNGLMYPGDPDGDIKERAGCRCRLVYKRNFFAGLR
jgi:hypothetical protein